MSAAKTNATVEKNKTKKPVDDVALPADDVIEDEKDESLEDEDLLEGIPEEELKAVESSAVAALPKVNSTRARARARRRSTDASVTMLTGDPVRMYLKEIGKVPLLTAAGRNRPRHENRGWCCRHRRLEKAEEEGIELERREEAPPVPALNR